MLVWAREGLDARYRASVLRVNNHKVCMQMKRDPIAYSVDYVGRLPPPRRARRAGRAARVYALRAAADHHLSPLGAALGIVREHGGRV